MIFKLRIPPLLPLGFYVSCARILRPIAPCSSITFYALIRRAFCRRRSLPSFRDSARMFDGSATPRRLTRETLAEKAELNIRSLQKIEAGDLNILITTATRIQRALGCSCDTLMRGV